MIRRYLLLLLLCISCSIHAIAQTDYYYYYYGNKIPLTLNEKKVVVSIPKENKDISERILLNVRVQATLIDEVFDIFILSRSDYETLTSSDTWSEDSKFVILTPSFVTERKEEVYTTPYLNVRLKKEEDIDLLTKYVEQYKIRIIRNIPSMPLWYILSLTLESEKGPIECANELWESGNFASSTPEFSTINVHDGTAVRKITVATDESLEIFDLQGRRLTDKPASGVYIENGKKIVIK